MAEPEATTAAPNGTTETEKTPAYLDQLEQAVKQAKEFLKAVESSAKKAAVADTKLAELLAKTIESQARADNEALRANQAKEFVEQHSNAAAKLKGSIEVDAAAIATKRAEIETIAQNFTNLRSRSEADATSIASSRKTADEAAKAVTETSGSAAAVQANISETKKTIDSLAQSVREETKTIQSDVAHITTAKESSANLLAAIQKTTATTNELHERAKTAQTAIEALEKAAKAKTESVSELIEKSQVLEKSVTEYEKNLARLQDEFAAMKDKVENLLPGATSAGLASAFCSQKQRFRLPRLAWMGTFLACIAGLLIIASRFHAPDPTWDAIGRELLQRLPFIVPLVWLGIYSGRQYMMSLRIEEDYAYKEAVSTAFEGYKRELASNPEAATRLYDNVLAVISRRPGLIYEGEQNDITPLTPAIEAAHKLIPATVEAVVAKFKGTIVP